MKYTGQFTYYSRVLIAGLILTTLSYASFGQDNSELLEPESEEPTERLEATLFVPNAFSPNSDGNNDQFRPKGTNLVDYHLTIYSRFGEQVFETRDLNQGWDGRNGLTSAREGHYVWNVRYEDQFGVVKNKQGTVFLTR